MEYKCHKGTCKRRERDRRVRIRGDGIKEGELRGMWGHEPRNVGSEQKPEKTQKQIFP